MKKNPVFAFCSALALVFVSSISVFALVTPTLGVTGVTATQTTAVADGTFENGWRWVFAVTVPEYENVVKVKFDDWTSGANTIQASNTRFYSAQSSNAYDAAHAIGITTANTYSDQMNVLVSADLDTVKAGTQIEVVVETKIPVGSALGAYTNSYGLNSEIDKVAPVITLTGSSTMVIEKDTVFVEPGYTALDNIDLDITSLVAANGTVNTAIPGQYNLFYSVTDSSLNKAVQATRSVTVVEDLEAPVAEVNDLLSNGSGEKITVPYGTLFNDIPGLPLQIDGEFENTPEYIPLDVTWFSDMYDPFTEGEQLVEGTFAIPAGYSNSQNQKASMYIEVLSENPAPTEPAFAPTDVAEVWFDTYQAPYGTSFADVVEDILPTQVRLILYEDQYESNPPQYYASVSWEEGSYDPNTSGAQSVYGTLTMPDGIGNPMNLKAEVVIFVSVPEIPASTE